ncbi:MAG TPA: hypothetical protein VEH07_03155 [Alphaproteobacteria bacterium]|nr:hypothetical protein [Alphaproteobacteria bacterium]
MSDSAIRARAHRLSWQFALPVFAGALVFVLMIVAGGRLLNDPDIYWHITVGNWIAAHRAFPHADPFSLTMAGKPWIAKEWASQLIFAAAYQVGGWNGIVAAAAAAIALTFALLERFLARELSPVPAFVLAMAALLLAAPHLVARPHVLAMPFMILWSGGLIAAADRVRAPSAALLPLMIAWANLHAGFTFGLALAIPLAVECVWRAKPRDRRHVAMLWLRFIALAFVAACMTPYGPQSMLTTFSVLGLGPALQIVNEWKPQDFTHIGAFEIALLGAIGFALHRGIKLPLMRLVLTLGLLHMALAHVRNSELLALIAPMVVARPLNAQLGAHAKENRDSDIGFAPLSSRAILAVVLVSLGAFAWLASALVERSPSKSASPKGAVDAINAAHISRVLNDYDFGGYLVARGLRPFIDGRTELYGGKFTAQENAAVTLEDLSGFLKILDQYDIQATLLNPARPANALLDRLPGWRCLYADDIAVVYARSAP